MPSAEETMPHPQEQAREQIKRVTPRFSGLTVLREGISKRSEL